MLAPILKASQDVGEAVHGDYVRRGLEEGELGARVPESADFKGDQQHAIAEGWGPFRGEN
jgi:hypothetical protein